MLKNNLGFPRIGPNRELKKACENYWAGNITYKELLQTGRQVKEQNWQIQKDAGIDLIPCNDFSFYDQVLDMALMVGAIPERYTDVLTQSNQHIDLDLYFAMARGYQKNNLDIIALEMTKWFDTNYHYLVPEFGKDQTFKVFSEKVVNEFVEAKAFLKKTPKPVIIGPVSFLLLGKEKETNFNRLQLLPKLLPVYLELIHKLMDYGAEWIQFDEPFLAMDINSEIEKAYATAYNLIRKECKGIKSMIATYFEGLYNNTDLALSLPVCALHLDLVRAPQQLDDILDRVPPELTLSLGVVDGRNIWKTNYKPAIELLSKAEKKLGKDRVMIAPSCSLLHCPYDLSFENGIEKEIKNWMAFSKQKLDELSDLSKILSGNLQILNQNQEAILQRTNANFVHQPAIKQKVKAAKETSSHRKSPFKIRQSSQNQYFNLPLFPTTTIGSFPQTTEIRKLRLKHKKREITTNQYVEMLKTETKKTIRLQEEIDLDVLVHGEFERNDMVEYFGEKLKGFLFTQNGWVQSYGSRCVKPPVIYGDISRTEDLTVFWSAFAQSLTPKPVKGMLTGPITILQWSFVRDDQPRSETAMQIALAIKEEVLALEKAGIGMIQIDEPAIREGLPLRRDKRNKYLLWAAHAFKLTFAEVRDTTQIHTHMCYSEFNDIIEFIAELDADVITLETSRSQMELLKAFASFKYPNGIGPGVYDIHSPRIPTVEEILHLLKKATELLPVENIWVNPDCGLKTRNWPETKVSLQNMVAAAKKARTIFVNATI